MIKFRENAMRVVFLLCACTSIVAVILICVFLFANGVPAIAEIGAGKFLLGTVWKPTSGQFGILPMIVGSCYVTAGAILFGVPLGVLTAVFLAKYCPKRIYGVFKPAINLLAGIPSVVFGFFGIVVLVPLIRTVFAASQTNGKTILTASLLLGLMILPTIVSVTESSLRAVQDSYYEGALALGATKERSIFAVLVPAAKSGILAGVILGIGRAIGETMAVVMVAGNQARIPSTILKGIRTMTANIVLEMGYATDLHRGALIATGVVLFVFILLINLLFSAVKRRDKR